jgi:RNA polymerase primary sigma factor
MTRRPSLSSPHARILPRDASLARYLREIARNRPLTNKEEAELTIRIRKGDQDALNRLVVSNLRFVVSVCRSYEHQGLPLIDLINEGNIGLIHAARRFDETKNFRFISYAVWWIRQAILQSLAKHSRIMRLPLNRTGCIHQIGKAQRKLEQRLRRKPTVNEIADELDIKAHVVETMLHVSARHSSIDAAFEGAAHGLHDTLPSDGHHEMNEELLEASLCQEVNKALDVLTARERDVVKLYFGVGHDTPHTLEEIGSRLMITRERVRQVKERALSKLQQSPDIDCLRPYLCGS